MTKEELKQEAEEYFEDETEGTFQICEDCYWFADAVQTAYVDSAEPREKRIAELELENKLLKADLAFSAKTSNKNKQTVKEYSKLVDEYSSEGVDLQDSIKELEKENAELKKKYVKNITDCDICDTYCNSQLTKAKELLQRVVKWATTETCKCEKFDFILADTKQFLNSEEK